MSQTQYLKLLEREIQKINKKIDLKILRGEDYSREAKDHKLMVRRMRYHRRQSLWHRLFPSFFSLKIFS